MESSFSERINALQNGSDVVETVLSAHQCTSIPKCFSCVFEHISFSLNLSPFSCSNVTSPIGKWILEIFLFLKNSIILRTIYSTLCDGLYSILAILRYSLFIYSFLFVLFFVLPCKDMNFSWNIQMYFNIFYNK